MSSTTSSSLRLPTFLGIGAPKAATTWLFQCLNEHPSIYMAPVKETDFFRRFGSEAADRYAEHFAGADDEAAIGEITTVYLSTPHVPERVHALLPDVQLLVCLRNPVDQVYSYFWHLERQNFHDRSNPNPETFEEGLEQYREKLLRPARYHEHLSRWLEYFDRDQFHFIFHEDVKSRPSAVVEDMYAFLDVDSSFRPSSIREQNRSTRRGTSPRHPFLNRVYLGLYDALVNYAYGPLKNLIGERRAMRWKNNLHVREIMESLFRKEGYPDMEPATRDRLRAYFDEDIRKLERLIGRDLSSWT